MSCLQMFWICPLIIKYPQSQESGAEWLVESDQQSMLQTQVKRFPRSASTAVSPRSIFGFDDICDRWLLTWLLDLCCWGGLLDNLEPVIFAFLFTHHRLVGGFNETPKNFAADISTRLWLWSLDYEISGAMAAWERITVFCSLLQAGLLLFLLLARSSGSPFKKCPGDKSCQTPRPPVVLSKYFLTVLSFVYRTVCCQIIVQPNRTLTPQPAHHVACDGGWHSR